MGARNATGDGAASGGCWRRALLLPSPHSPGFSASFSPLLCATGRAFLGSSPAAWSVSELLRKSFCIAPCPCDCSGPLPPLLTGVFASAPSRLPISSPVMQSGISHAAARLPLPLTPQEISAVPQLPCKQQRTRRSHSFPHLCPTTPCWASPPLPALPWQPHSRSCLPP